MDRLTFHSDFCPVCGALIELQSISDNINCQVCSSQLSFQQFAGKVMKTELTVRKDKEWLYKYDTNRKMLERRGKSKMVIKHRCAKCGHDQMTFYTVQLRSVDEGSTVFYECEKCDYTETHNN